MGALPNSHDDNILLEDYSTFQYMLARPSVAAKIVNQIASFVFYDEPHDPRKDESEHKVMVQGTTGVMSYYVCCLLVLPSHALGMSRWVSSADHTRRKGNGDNDILRKFKYTYYGGLLKVDTRHMRVAEGCDKFRLVEFFDWSRWSCVVIAEAFLAATVAAVSKCFEATGIISMRGDVSLSLLVAYVLLPIHVMGIIYLAQFSVAATTAKKKN